MYLKRLQIQGFKTFAQKTEFLYDTGITAIVGPNGSGKSNIADAIRWVLGEQRYSVLRGRKTEDVIFAGSNLKPAMGYAEASITFDNTDHKLPLDFGEVTITRRAYRTGENEYYINKSRVRLKDIAEATLPLSQTYTVITQGMVDAALSQKPEERRGLFEDAASIGLYNLKKAEAEHSLAKQEENARSVGLMISEIEPRLKTLERHARQAEEYYTLQEELQVLLKRHYGDRYRKLRTNLETAQKQERASQTAFERAKTALESLQRELETARAIQNRQRSRLAELHQTGSQLHTQAQHLQQQVAVDRERLNGLTRQREREAQERVSLELALESSRARRTELEALHAAALAEQKGQATHIAAQEAAMQSLLAQARQTEEQRERQRAEVTQYVTRLENVRQRRTQLTERQKALTEQQEQYFQNLANIANRQSGLEDEMDVAQGILAGLEEEVRQITERRKQLEGESTAAAAAIRKSEQAVQQARARLESGRSRLELLQRLQTSFTGLHSGVRTVMQAASGSQPRLKGILGLVSNLLQVPAELEIAVEVALGGHLQDIVAEQFEDAEAAIKLLKTGGSGRATFLPLDNLRPVAPTRLPQALAQRPGVRGVACDLVRFEAQYRPVYEQLLGRVLVVEDLVIGRAALRELGGGWMIVTLGGEILRSSGAVTGGVSGQEKDRAEGSVLMRERELRELPQEVARLEKQIAEQAAALSLAQGRAGAVRQQTNELERESQNLSRRQQQARDKRDNLRNQLDRLTQELKLREESHQSLTREMDDLKDKDAALVAEHQEVTESHLQALGRLGELEKAVSRAGQAAGEEREKLAALRTAAALAGQRLKNSQENLDLNRAETTRLQSQLASRTAHLAELDGQGNSLEAALTASQTELQAVAQRLETVQADITPLESELARLEKGLTDFESRRAAASRELLALEGAFGRANLETRRFEADNEALRERAAADLAPALRLDGTVEAEAIAVDPAQWEELLELTDREAVQLAERVEQLRNRLRRLGPVNPLAMQEFTETSQRYDFLTTQLKDLEEASRTLRGLIKELDELTQTRFAATFEKVADEFKRFFGLLFNGGTARLVLTSPDNLADTGIEIMAQPPGKRPQSLALLSGGERALTAVALLFALLEVNPAPFCVLDEVDAALDESNVGRFCETLRTLAHRTQFIIVTHNRGTIEAARTIYGVSMGADSVSKVISLRVDEVPDFKQNGAKRKASLTAPALN